MSELDYEFDPETGEIINYQPMANHPSGAYEVRIAADAFKIDSKESAEWVLKKLLDYDLTIEAVKSKRKIINANLDHKETGLKNARDKLADKVGEQLEGYASEMLKNSKNKSLLLDYGKIGFREVRGSTTVLNADAAVHWLKLNEIDDAIKTVRSVLVSKIPENTELPPELFEVKPPYTKFYIDTGVK